MLLHIQPGSHQEKVFPFQTFENTQFLPHFHTLLPAGWEVESQALAGQDGRLFACQGPLSATNGRPPIRLEILLVAHGPWPQHHSLEAYQAFSLNNEAIGQVVNARKAERAVGPRRGLESSLLLQRSVMTPGGLQQIQQVKRWVTCTAGNFFVTVMYEAPRTDYPLYLSVYNRCLTNWRFLK